MRRVTCLYWPLYSRLRTGDLFGPLGPCLPRYPVPGVPANGFCKDSAHANAKERRNSREPVGTFCAVAWIRCPHGCLVLRSQLVYVGKMKKEIKLQTAEGDQSFPLLLRKTKTGGLGLKPSDMLAKDAIKYAVGMNSKRRKDKSEAKEYLNPVSNIDE